MPGAPGAAAGPNHRSDVGRRVALRREQLGLSREDVAERAGVAPEYLRYLEEQPASPSLPSLTRVARALQCTVAELSGVETTSAVSQPPVEPGEPAELSAEECHELLAAHTVGRVAVDTPDGPAIVPVNYTYAEDEDAVVFRTAPGAAPSFAEGADVAFEVDRLDEAQRVGWSVMVAGAAQRITDPAAIERLAARAHTEPWGGERPLWVRVAAERVSGRRVPLG
ncbi:helix-turn-helix domain-containing protein [Streptomyces sp. 6N223]|uniref:helix-turn-helix domain-containing protein n=1 Tax=Streptomyces sp. 6N223 TaxID=3457412 RepID=UPI003FD0154E